MLALVVSNKLTFFLTPEMRFGALFRIQSMRLRPTGLLLDNASLN